MRKVTSQFGGALRVLAFRRYRNPARQIGEERPASAIACSLAIVISCRASRDLPPQPYPGS